MLPLRSGADRGMIFQRYSSFPNRTVLKNVTFGLEINQRELKLSRSAIEDLAANWLEKVGGLKGTSASTRINSAATTARGHCPDAGVETTDHPDGRTVLSPG